MSPKCSARSIGPTQVLKAATAPRGASEDPFGATSSNHTTLQLGVSRLLRPTQPRKSRVPFTSPHVIERWIQRVDPGLSPEEARDAVRRFLQAAQLVSERPYWLKGPERRNSWYLVAPEEFPGVVGIGCRDRLKTVVANRRAGQCSSAGSTVRFVGFEPSAFHAKPTTACGTRKPGPRREHEQNTQGHQ